jgi:hypothetical protein
MSSASDALVQAGKVAIGVLLDLSPDVAEIALIPAKQAAAEGAGGGHRYSDATPRAPQLLKVSKVTGLDGREESQRDEGTNRKFNFEVVGPADAEIEIGDHWEDEIASYTIETVDRTTPYKISALAVGYLKTSGHSYG